MICKPNTDNDVFPFLVVDDFYNQDEQKLIWDELELHSDKFVRGGGGVAKDETGFDLASLKRFSLDRLYEGHRQDSNILSVYGKVCSEDVKKAYRETTPSSRTFESTNNDATIVNYYESADDYKEHADVFMHSCLIFFYKQPKKFTGGNLIFTQPNATVECVHNRMILFPSYYLHKITEVKMEKQYINKGLGRYSMAHFYTYNN